MKKLLMYIGIGLSLIAFSGCATKEFETKNYFDAFTKDEVLQAGKWVFLAHNSNEYVIDSYRDRLEVTKIGIVFSTLTHKDFVLRVEENECGTDATLKIAASLGMKKMFNHNVLKLEHQFFWDEVRDFLASSEKMPNENTEDAKKECSIKNEFENGLIKSTSIIGEVENEAL